MSAVLQQRNSEQEFLSAQQLPPDKRGISFEALFFRQLQLVTTQAGFLPRLRVLQVQRVLGDEAAQLLVRFRVVLQRRVQVGEHVLHGLLVLLRAPQLVDRLGPKCIKTGYKGRVGLHELLVADDEIKRLVRERARVADILVAAVAGGMRTLKMDGMEKILMGLTDLKQVRSVCIR